MPAQKTFISVKKAFATVSIFAYLDSKWKTWIRYNVSDYLVATAESQGYHGRICFHSKDNVSFVMQF